MRKTPEVPLWTSVQVFGARYGPSPGYWFPRERDGERDVLRLLNDVTAAKYEDEHPLTGMMLQKWDSEESPKRSLQDTLGDAVLPGQPADQVQAALEAVRTLNDWLAARDP